MGGFLLGFLSLPFLWSLVMVFGVVLGWLVLLLLLLLLGGVGV